MTYPQLNIKQRRERVHQVHLDAFTTLVFNLFTLKIQLAKAIIDILALLFHAKDGRDENGFYRNLGCLVRKEHLLPKFAREEAVISGEISNDSLLDEIHLNAVDRNGIKGQLELIQHVNKYFRGVLLES